MLEGTVPAGLVVAVLANAVVALVDVLCAGYVTVAPAGALFVKSETADHADVEVV